MALTDVLYVHFLLVASCDAQFLCRITIYGKDSETYMYNMINGGGHFDDCLGTDQETQKSLGFQDREPLFPHGCDRPRK
jgi:hypothetical protein